MPPDTELTELAASRASLWGYRGAVANWFCLRQNSPSWPRAGHPCGDTRCRYQLALSAAMGAMVLGSELTNLAASRASLRGCHGAVTSWLCPSPIHRRKGAVTRIKPDVTKLAVSYRATL